MNAGVMKVTTQRTNKAAKILMLAGFLAVLVGIYGFMSSKDWSLTVFLCGGLLWVIGKLCAWFFNE